MTAALLTEWSRLLLGTLARAGVEQVVVSPGSRSTPFAWAALNEPRLTCHSLWDERVAAFFALGQARLSGKPSLLLCTSGTAAANYYPALIEASLARIPVLVLTADRPFELQHSAAPQTIDQTKLFGDSARAFFELGMPDESKGALQGLVRGVAHAVARSLAPEPGPVQLNARARKPLEPSTATDPASLAVRHAVDELLAAGPTRAATSSAHADISRLAEACARAERGLIVVGPHAASERESLGAVARLAELTGFPLLCESGSQLRIGGHAPRCVDAFEWLFRSEKLRHELMPDFVLSFGAPPVSGAYERFLLQSYRGPRFVVAEHGFPDPHGLATEILTAKSGDVAGELLTTFAHAPLAPRAARAKYATLVAEANAQAWRAVERQLARETDTLSEPRAVRTLLEALPSPCTLVLGNSLPIREADAYLPASTKSVRVLTQRGANGIDGLIAGAAGAASLSTEPTVLVLGDVSFLHDVGGLAAARATRGPLVIAVIDNGGGRIFEQLPLYAELQKNPDKSRFWLTPPNADLSHAAALFGHHYEQVTRDGEIAPAFARALAHGGASVLHVIVEGSSARAAEASVVAELERAVTS